MVWGLPLYILYVASILSLVLADFQNPNTLDTCILTVQSTVAEVANPRTLIIYGIWYRFATSDPPVNPLTVVDGGTSDVFEDLGNGIYAVGFAVESDTYGSSQLKDIVTEQWSGTNLFEWDVGSAGNWMVLSANC